MTSELIQKLKAKAKKENKRSLIFDCPKCGKKEKFSYEKTTGRGICYAGSCGVKTSATESVRLILGLSWDEAKVAVRNGGTAADVQNLVLTLKGDGQVSSNELTDEDLEEEVIQAMEYKIFLLDPLTVPAEESEEAMAFLAKRGVTDMEKIKAFRLRHHPVMRGLLAPVYMKNFDNDIETNGFQVRRYQNPAYGPKVLSCSGMEKSKLLLNYVSAKKAENVVLSEGIIDTIKATQKGFCGVGSFGKAVSAEQLNLLKQLSAKNIYLALDRDAFDLIDRMASTLRSAGKNVFRVLPPSHRGDIGDCTDEEILEAYRNAESITGIKTQRLEVWLKE